MQVAQQEQLRLTEQCQALYPRWVLKRGYALVRDNSGAIIRNSENLVIGAELSIQFGNGRAKVSVVESGDGKED